MESSREEVLAAVAETEERLARTREHMKTVVFPDVPEGYEGCVWSTCGTVRAHYGKTADETDPHMIAQRAAGEEDQSPPEDWVP